MCPGGQLNGMKLDAWLGWLAKWMKWNEIQL